jgi:uncharacterized damage-inducible protein DinB
MPTQTPYSADLGDRDPLRAIRDSGDRIRQLTNRWSADAFERSYAPGKWTARQILIHLAQTELALGNRARMALTTPNYGAQKFDQDQWVEREGTLDARTAVDALVALMTMNRRLFESLSDADRAIPLTHPEYGALTVDWIICLLAGHQIHHLAQLEQIDQAAAV